MRNWSLPRKIAMLGLANLGALAVVLLVFARWQFGVGPGSLIAGAAADRILGIANGFRLELDSTPDKAAVIASYARRYEADVFVTNPQGDAIFGPEVTLPGTALHRMRPGPRRGAPPARGEGPPGRPPHRDGPPSEPFILVTSANPTRYWAVVRIPVAALEGTTRPGMLIFRTDSLFNSKLFFDWKPWVALGAALMGVSLFCWLPFLRKLTGSIREMDRVTKEIAHGRFEARVPEDRRDELGDLGRQINTMATRLESFVSSQKRFLGDAAHELSAPLARIQFALGILDHRVEEARRADIEVLRDEIQEMSVLVNELLSFSKASLDPAASPLLDRVDVAELVRRAAAREGVNPEILVEKDLAALARPGPLLRAVGNLLRNASRYAGEFGPIEVAARQDGGRAVITVADHGPGLPEEALEQVFEPFWRLQASRTRDQGGAGLGMAIVKSSVEACGGTVTCRNRQPCGLEVTIRLEVAED